MTERQRTEVLAELERVPEESVEAVLALLKQLPSANGKRGEKRRELPFGPISAEDAKEMMEAIEEGCGRVDPSEW